MEKMIDLLSEVKFIWWLLIAMALFLLITVRIAVEYYKSIFGYREGDYE